MSRLIMWNTLTLDGFFDGIKSFELEWHRYIWDEELERFSLEQLRSADRLIFGRVTYEGMSAYWKTAKGEVTHFMNYLPKVVFSRTLERAEWANTTLVKDNLRDTIAELKRQGDRNMFVFGSGDLCAQLIQQDLFDEYRLGLAPVVLGRGKPLFGRDLGCMRMKLVETRTLSTGCAILRYEPLRAHKLAS
jgi:dihydrofolate reductase